MSWSTVRDDAGARSWLERFQGFADGILRRVEVRYRSSSAPPRAVIEVSTRDATAGDWTNVIIEVRGLVEHSVAEGGPRGSYQILSNGLHVLFREDVVIVELGYFADPPSSLAQARQSPFYLVGSELHWQLAPYAE